MNKSLFSVFLSMDYDFQDSELRHPEWYSTERPMDQ